MNLIEDRFFYLFSFFQYLSEQSPIKNKEKPPNGTDVAYFPHQLISSSVASFLFLIIGQSQANRNLLSVTH